MVSRHDLIPSTALQYALICACPRSPCSSGRWYWGVLAVYKVLIGDVANLYNIFFSVIIFSHVRSAVWISF